MSNLSEQVYGKLIGSVDGGAAPVFFLNRGFVDAITRNGAGDYTLTISTGQGCDLQTGALVTLTVGGATPLISSVEVLTTTTFRCRFETNAGVATDTDFWVSVQQIANT